MTFTVNASLLDAIVLSVVSTEDTYGYKITQEVNKIIGVSESTLYPVLRRLQKDNNLEVYDMEYLGRNRRYYKITNKGKVLLNLYQEEWVIYKDKIDRVFDKDFESFEDFGEDENPEQDDQDKPEKKSKSAKTAEETIETISKLGHKLGEKIDNLKIPEKIDNLKIPEKIENLKIGEKFDNLKIPEKLEHLKIPEKIEDLAEKAEHFYVENMKKIKKDPKNKANENEDDSDKSDSSN